LTPVRDSYPAELRLDDRVEELAEGVVTRIGFDPPEVQQKLRPPRLRVIKGVPHGLNSYSIPRSDGTTVILVGAGLYTFFHHYTRAAATYFLPSQRGGRRPSGFWPRARSALAITLDWISSPASAPHYSDFNLSPYQARAAKALGDYAFRFALCHEIAHVALGHVDVDPSELRRVAREDVSVLRVSQEQELDADAFGLDLQIKSLPDSTQLVNGLAGAMYFLYITRLLDARLMLVAHLVDYQRWRVSYTHPPSLHRVFNLMSAAETLHEGSASGLETLHGSLAAFGGQVWDTANVQQDEVAAKTLRLLNDEIARQMEQAPLHTRSRRRKERKPQHTDELPADVTRELLELFGRSPLGSLRALDERRHVADTRDKVALEVLEQFALVLPTEFQRFYLQTQSERAASMTLTS
jgi:hypothetical protein